MRNAGSCSGLGPAAAAGNTFRSLRAGARSKQGLAGDSAALQCPAVFCSARHVKRGPTSFARGVAGRTSSCLTRLTALRPSAPLKWVQGAEEA